METRDEILAHTADLIQTHGFNGFSYKDIAERLGIAKASIHHHFPNKEALGIAYCENKVLELRVFREKIHQAKSARAKLNAYFEKPKHRLSTRKMCGINAMQSDSAEMSGELRAALKELTKVDIDIVREILEEGKAAGEFVFSPSPQELAIVITSALKGGLQCSRLNDDDTYIKMCSTVENMLGVGK